MKKKKVYSSDLKLQLVKEYLNCKSQYLDVQKMENKNVQKIELRIRNI